MKINLEAITNRINALENQNHNNVYTEHNYISTSDRVLTKSDSDIKEKNHEENHFDKYWGYYLFILLELVIILLFGLFSKFGHATDAKHLDDLEDVKSELSLYPIFQDIHVMIFIGFGFLMTFLKTYSWTSVTLNFFIASFSIQIVFLCIHFWTCVLKNDWVKLELSIAHMIDADFGAGSILIAFGAVLGKLHIFQFTVMAMIQSIIYGLQFVLCFKILGAVDLGGSITIHMFGAIFGVVVALMLRNHKAINNPNNTSNYNSNLFSMIGTIFLFLYWPSFNGAFGKDHSQHRAIINTYLCLTGSTIAVFVATPFTHHGKLEMETILNSTLAGGVVIGSTADLITLPWVSIFIGFFIGIISVIGYRIINPFLVEKIQYQDTCGVLYLHGIPGFIGAVISIIISGAASESIYGPSLFLLFPKLENGRSSRGQAGIQVAQIMISLGTAIVGGILTGFILKSSMFSNIENLFYDNVLFEMPEKVDEEKTTLNNIHFELDEIKNIKNSFKKGTIDTERPLDTENRDVAKMI